MKRTIRPVLAVLAVLLAASIVPEQASAQDRLKLSTIVIDPGHGGHDPGCISADKKTREKNVALDIAQRLSRKIGESLPGVKTVLTRSDDTFVTLSGRADIANDLGADLFISIHVNAQAKGTSANGYSIHCLGQSSREGNDLFSKNLDLIKRENSVILLEDDYKTRYQGFDPSDPQSYILFSLVQNAHLEHSLVFAEDVANAMKGGPIPHNRGVSQDPFWVLWRTTMPAVLVEVGFMTNANDLKALRSPEDRDKIAENLLKAIKTFKKRARSGTGDRKGLGAVRRRLWRPGPGHLQENETDRRFLQGIHPGRGPLRQALQIHPRHWGRPRRRPQEKEGTGQEISGLLPGL